MCTSGSPDPHPPPFPLRPFAQARPQSQENGDNNGSLCLDKAVLKHGHEAVRVGYGTAPNHVKSIPHYIPQYNAVMRRSRS